MTDCSSCRAENISSTLKRYREQGYTHNWKTRNVWRSTWGFTGIRVQVKEVKIDCPPDMGPITVSRWKTVFTF